VEEVASAPAVAPEVPNVALVPVVDVAEAAIAPPAARVVPEVPRAAPSAGAAAARLEKSPRAAALAASVATDSPKPAKSKPPASAPASSVSLAPASVQTAAPRPVMAAPAPSAVVEVGARDANRVLGSLSHAYEDGDLQRMRTLFAEDAHGPRGGLDSILAEYNRVFEDTRQRSLSVRDVNWFLSGDTFTIIASFEATVTSNRTGRARRSRGDLRLDLRREGERWQIYRMQHDEKPG
jgi:ketosteroid isomerase-like protein